MESTKVALTRPRPRDGWLALALSLVVIATAVFRVVLRSPQAAEALVYSYSFQEGQSRTYAMNMRMNVTPRGASQVAQAMDMTMTSKLAVKAVKVNTDGSALLELTVTDVKFSGPTGPQHGAFPKESMRMLVSRNGEVLEVEGSSVFGTFDPARLLGVPSDATGGTLGSANIFPTFPSKAIAPGDKWSDSQSIRMPFGDGTIKVTADGKHEGFEDTAYGRAARMAMRLEMPMDVSFTFADIFSLAGSAGAQSEALKSAIPNGLESMRMFIKGTMHSDMDALVPPDGSDLVKMVADMDMDIAMRAENLTPQTAQGQPSSFEMAMKVRMEMSRID
jgi:hypothetical protein